MKWLLVIYFFTSALEGEQPAIASYGFQSEMLCLNAIDALKITDRPVRSVCIQVSE